MPPRKSREPVKKGKAAEEAAAKESPQPSRNDVSNPKDSNEVPVDVPVVKRGRGRPRKVVEVVQEDDQPVAQPRPRKDANQKAQKNVVQDVWNAEEAFFPFDEMGEEEDEFDDGFDEMGEGDFHDLDDEDQDEDEDDDYDNDGEDDDYLHLHLHLHPRPRHHHQVKTKKTKTKQVTAKKTPVPQDPSLFDYDPDLANPYGYTYRVSRDDKGKMIVLDEDVHSDDDLLFETTNYKSKWWELQEAVKKVIRARRAAEHKENQKQRRKFEKKYERDAKAKAKAAGVPYESDSDKRERLRNYTRPLEPQSKVISPEFKAQVDALKAKTKGAIIGRHDDTSVNHASILYLLKSPHLGSIDALILSGANLTDDSIKALVGNKGLGNLKALVIANCGLTDAALHEIARSPHTSKLKLLNIARNRGVTSVGLNALCGAKNLKALERFSAASCSIDDANLLAKSAATFPALACLDLSHNQLKKKGLHGFTLKTCNLANTQIRGIPRNGLSQLRLRNVGMNQSTILEICRIPSLIRTLTWFDFRENRIKSQSLRHIRKYFAGSVIMGTPDPWDGTDIPDDDGNDYDTEGWDEVEVEEDAEVTEEDLCWRTSRGEKEQDFSFNEAIMTPDYMNNMWISP